MRDRIPKPGEIYNHFKDKPYQIITIATHTETEELMVVYQALYGDFKTYVRPLPMFLSEIDHNKYPDVKQKYRFELRENREVANVVPETIVDKSKEKSEELQGEIAGEQLQVEIADKQLQGKMAGEQLQNDVANVTVPEGNVNAILLQFLDAESYNRKLDVINSNRKHLNDRLINDMAVSLDCAVDEGPIEQRIKELIFCLQAMSRFEDRRLR